MRLRCLGSGLNTAGIAAHEESQPARMLRVEEVGTRGLEAKPHAILQNLGAAMKTGWERCEPAKHLGHVVRSTTLLPEGSREPLARDPRDCSPLRRDQVTGRAAA